MSGRPGRSGRKPDAAVQAIRTQIDECITADDWREIWLSAAAAAKQGSIPAMKLLATYRYGPATAQILEEPEPENDGRVVIQLPSPAYPPLPDGISDDPTSPDYPGAELLAQYKSEILQMHWDRIAKKYRAEQLAKGNQISTLPPSPYLPADLYDDDDDDVYRQRAVPTRPAASPSFPASLISADQPPPSVAPLRTAAIAEPPHTTAVHSNATAALDSPTEPPRAIQHADVPINPSLASANPDSPTPQSSVGRNPPAQPPRPIAPARHRPPTPPASQPRPLDQPPDVRDRSHRIVIGASILSPYLCRPITYRNTRHR